MQCVQGSKISLQCWKMKERAEKGEEWKERAGTGRGLSQLAVVKVRHSRREVGRSVHVFIQHGRWTRAWFSFGFLSF